MRRYKGRRVSPVLTDETTRIATLLRMEGITPTRERVEAFRRWMYRNQWEKFNQEEMDKLNMAKSEFDKLSFHFPNAKNGEDYFHKITLPVKYLDNFRLPEFPDGSGLVTSIDKDGNFSIQGTPAKAADYTLVFTATPRNYPDKSVLWHKEFTFCVNPNPWDLWQDLPVSENLPFKKDNEVSEYVRVDRFGGERKKDIVAASKRGRSHAHEGKARDDDFKIEFLPDNGWYLLTVADGAGSAKYSREGSRLAVKTMHEWCALHLNESGIELEAAIERYQSDAVPEDNFRRLYDEISKLLYTGAKRAYQAIERCVAGCNEPSATMRDFSTTLLTAVCRKFDFGWFIASFAVGDGAIALYEKDSDKIRLLNEPDGGEYAGQTRFLTMKSIFSDRARVRFSIVPDFTALMLMTDGVSDPFFDTDANLNSKSLWDNLWHEITRHVDLSDDNPHSERELLQWLDFKIAGHHDDRTIAILY